MSEVSIPYGDEGLWAGGGSVAVGMPGLLVRQDALLLKNASGLRFFLEALYHGHSQFGVEPFEVRALRGKHVVGYGTYRVSFVDVGDPASVHDPEPVKLLVVEDGGELSGVLQAMWREMVGTLEGEVFVRVASEAGSVSWSTVLDILECGLQGEQEKVRGYAGLLRDQFRSDTILPEATRQRVLRHLEQILNNGGEKGSPLYPADSASVREFQEGDEVFYPVDPHDLSVGRRVGVVEEARVIMQNPRRLKYFLRDKKDGTELARYGPELEAM